jgi:hypothetical protein
MELAVVVTRRTIVEINPKAVQIYQYTSVHPIPVFQDAKAI